jgi:hypothetical protein
MTTIRAVVYVRSVVFRAEQRADKNPTVLIKGSRFCDPLFFQKIWDYEKIDL